MNNSSRRRFLRLSIGAVLSTTTLATGTAAISAQLPDEELKSFLLSGQTSVSGVNLRHKEKLRRVYTERNFIPIWSENGQYTNTPRAIVEKLEGSSILGLDPAQYYTQVLASWLNTQGSYSTRQLELVLTDSLFEYFDNLANGQTGKLPGDASSWFGKQRVTDTQNIAMSFFRGAVSFRDAINQLQPESEHYNNLLLALREHHQILNNGGYQTIDAGGTLKPGTQDYRVKQLRQRLAQSKDYPGGYASASDHFDHSLEDALISFQNRHGLEADGMAGSKTLKALNTSVEERIAQIEINLDRWRWLPQDLGDNHIVVNTAGFQMDLVLNGYKNLSMDVIVGRNKRETPIFSDEMEHMVFNPTWNVPKSIARRDLLPKELANPGYLHSNNYVALSRSDKSNRALNTFSSGELEPSVFNASYRLMQKAGSDNALGSVKFMFPNQYSIYLHDTNAKNLFEETNRAHSSGCVRVKDPVALAKTLLMNEGHSEYGVEELFASQQTKAVSLQNKVPVHITYQTAWVDESGSVNFRDDIYGHDDHALQNYRTQRPQLAQQERHLLTQLSGIEVAISNTL